MKFKMLRKRYIPEEIIDISDDEVLYIDNEKIITKWLPIKPRRDIGSGLSISYIQKGWKISKFFDNNGKFMYWYCDIIKYEKRDEIHIFTDLLVDIRINLDGKYEILDLDELIEAYETKLIDIGTFLESIKKLDGLLKLIYNNEMPEEEFEKYR